MFFECDACGIQLKLQIHGYKPTNENNWDETWCRCDFSFTSGDWLNYRKVADEVLLASEVDQLASALRDLLDNRLTEETEFRCMEPDFLFKLYPQKDLREDPQYIYVRPGYEIQDIYLEWRVYFWHEGITDNYLTVTLCREEIANFRDYLVSVIG